MDAEGAMAESGRKKWLAYECFGCLGVLGLVVLLVGAFAGLGALRARSEKIVEKEFTREMPSVAIEAAPAAPSAPQAPADPPVQRQLEEVRGAGRVVLELRKGNEFVVKPARPGEPLHVSATFDESTYSLTETFQEPSDGPWVYTVVFERTASGLVTAVKELISGNRPEVEVLIPEGVPIELEVRAAEGGLIVDLGGLWLTEADFFVDKGGLILDVSRPLARPMERLGLEASMGGLVAESLGNASPRELTVGLHIGGMSLDLDGEWITDSDISISLRMGGGRVELPRNVLIEGLDDRGIGTMERPEIAPPTLRFSVEGDPDDIEFER